MRLPVWTRAAFAGFAVAGLVGSAGTAEAAGLFEFLFGGSQPSPRYDYDYGNQPLGVQVNPRKRKPQKMSAIPDGASKAKLQTPIDPVKNPTWYLTDPTLRRGDIIVLKGKVVVYDGGRSGRDSNDFTPLDQSRLVSRGERERIGKMAKGNGGLASVEMITIEPSKAAGKEASLR